MNLFQIKQRSHPIEAICILTVSFYAALILLLICLLFGFNDSKDIMTQQLFHPELTRQVILALLVGLLPAILSFRWLNHHP
jgi:uncharacterized membrane protein